MSTLAIEPTQIDARQVVKEIARRTLHSASGISASDRQWLHDIKRDRVAMGNMVRLLELMPTAELNDATGGAESIHSFIVATKLPTVPFWSDAFVEEQQANHAADLAQLAWAERRSESNGDAVREWMLMQALRSRRSADSVTVHLVGKRSIHVVSR